MLHGPRRANLENGKLVHRDGGCKADGEVRFAVEKFAVEVLLTEGNALG